MPNFLYYCPKCEETREYMLINSSAIPQECSNPECGVNGGFLRKQYHGQTVSSTSSSKSGHQEDNASGVALVGVEVQFACGHTLVAKIMGSGE